MSMLCCEMKVSHARSVHWLYDCPSQTRKEDIMGIDISHIHTVEVGYDEFCGALAARDLQPLWKIAKQLMPEVPLPTTQAWLWKWDDVLPLARRAGARQSWAERSSVYQHDALGCAPVPGAARIGTRSPAHAQRHPVRPYRFRSLYDRQWRRLRNGAGRLDSDANLELA